MSDTSLRYLEMLWQVPREPNGITVQQLHAKLADLGYAVDKRSVERDLVKLSVLFPLGSSEPRPARWYWMQEAEQSMLPGLNPAAALAFELASRHLAALMPRSALDALQPMFQSARKRLDELKASGYGHWSDQVAIVPETLALLPPKVPDAISQVVQQALLENRRIDISYQAADRDTPKRYPVNPLGLVARGGAHYLVGSAREYREARVFALHRIADAVLLDEPAKRLPGFNLDAFVRTEHVFDQPRGGTLKLELHVSPWLAHHLDERRLATDQTLTPIRGREELRLRATVPDTEQLRWWLRSFGTAVEVVKPVALRREMAGGIAALGRMYRR